MSLFLPKSQMPKSAAFALTETVPEPSSPDGHQVLKKKRTFFRHGKTSSSASLTQIMVPRDVPLSPTSPHSAREVHEDSPLASPRRSSSSARKLQKRPPSTSGSSSRASPVSSPVSSPNYVLEKPPRIPTKDYAPSHQNLYILDDGQDDEMYTLFEMISGNRPMIIKDPAANPELSPDTKQRKSKGPHQSAHSRNTSSSSAYSVMSSSTYETEFSDFQFEFGLDHDRARAIRSTAAPCSSQVKPTLNMGIINEHPSVETHYEDCVASIGDLTTDDDSDYSSDYGDDFDDVVLEEGLAVQVFFTKVCMPTMITLSSKMRYDA
ncbi:hypothetical protein DRE_07394 [Drechslerella stenobrocha 248]|uniref:Uncharacterized protein n=1 Tax=Drechslerella stenobrocha 248 TaxID=1043628 RepID=W7HL28_9PEZI|nr:hypothetical protein DRE_07394 [Drechslerella stenobrocha 248]